MGRKKCPMCDITKDTLEVVKRPNNKIMCDACYDEIKTYTSNAAKLASQSSRSDGATSLSDYEDDDSHIKHCIQSELLSYVQYYISRSSADSLKATLIRFYGQADIVKAKQLLWKCVKDKEAIGVIQNRITTASRPAYEADAQDIITAFQKLDSEAVAIPVFASVDLNKIPKFGPEEMCNAAVRDKLSAVEQRLKLMESIVHGNSDSIKALEVTVQQGLLDNDQNKWPRLPPKKPVVFQSAPPRDINISRPSTPRGHLLPSVPAETSIWMGASPRSVPEDNRTRQEKIKPSKEPEKDQSERNEWEMTREQRLKIRREKRRKETVVGKRENNSVVKSGQKHIKVFVFRVHPDESEESIKSFISSEGVEVVGITQVSNENAFMKSFKVTINFEDMSKVLDEDFWPMGICCRKFYEKRS